jgi:hypothetical protein
MPHPRRYSRSKSAPLVIPNHPVKQTRERMLAKQRSRKRKPPAGDPPLEPLSPELAKELSQEASPTEIAGLDPPPQAREISSGQHEKLSSHLGNILYPSRLLVRDRLKAADLQHLEKLNHVPRTAEEMGLTDRICIRLVKAGYACRWYASHWLYSRFRPAYRYTRIPDYKLGKEWRHAKRDPFSQILTALQGQDLDQLEAQGEAELQERDGGEQAGEATNREGGGFSGEET